MPNYVLPGSQNVPRHDEGETDSGYNSLHFEPVGAIGQPPTCNANWNRGRERPYKWQRSVRHQTQYRESYPEDFPLHLFPSTDRLSCTAATTDEMMNLLVEIVKIPDKFEFYVLPLWQQFIASYRAESASALYKDTQCLTIVGRVVDYECSRCKTGTGTPKGAAGFSSPRNRRVRSLRRGVQYQP